MSKDRESKKKSIAKTMDSSVFTVTDTPIQGGDKKAIIVATPQVTGYGMSNAELVSRCIQDKIDIVTKSGPVTSVEFEQKEEQAKPGAYALQLLRRAKRVNVKFCREYIRCPEKLTDKQISALEASIAKRIALIEKSKTAS